jgi:predicted secreted protein
VKFETIMVAVGREFTVRLKSDSRTGYFWRVCALAEGVEFIGSCLDKPRDSPLHDVKAIQVFRFRAVAAGEYTIRFFLEGQKDADAIQTHTVTVIAS